MLKKYIYIYIYIYNFIFNIYILKELIIFNLFVKMNRHF